MTLLSLVGASFLALALAAGDDQPLEDAHALRDQAFCRLKTANLDQGRVASRLHDLESLRAGQTVAADRLDDLRSIVLDVASPGTGFGVRWTHPLLDLTGPSNQVLSGLPDTSSRSFSSVIAPSHRGPVAAFGLTLIFASVLSGGSDRKIHATSPEMDDTLPVESRTHGEPQMTTTAILAPESPSTDQEIQWMPTPVDALEVASLQSSIDDEDEGDLFYFDDEDDDQEEDEDDGFFFDDDEDQDEDEDEDDDLESDGGVSPEDDEDDEEGSGFSGDDDEEYEFED